MPITYISPRLYDSLGAGLPEHAKAVLHEWGSRTRNYSPNRVFLAAAYETFIRGASAYPLGEIAGVLGTNVYTMKRSHREILSRLHIGPSTSVFDVTPHESGRSNK